MMPVPSRSAARGMLAGTLPAAAIAALVGCTSDSDPTPTPAQPSTVAAPQPTFSQPAGAIQELSEVRCAKGKNGWSFEARLKNTGKLEQTYTVNVAIAMSEGGTVVGQTTIKKTLKAGAATDLSAKNFYRGSKSDVVCVPSATKAAA